MKYAAEGSKEMKLLTLFLPLLKKACLGISDMSSKIQQQTLTAENCFVTKHQINQFLNLKWHTLCFSRKEIQEVTMKMLITLLLFSQFLQLRPQYRLSKQKPVTRSLLTCPICPTKWPTKIAQIRLLHFISQQDDT